MSDNTGFAGLWRMLGYLPLFRTTILDTTWFQLSGGHVEVGRTDGRTDGRATTVRKRVVALQYWASTDAETNCKIVQNKHQ